MGEQAYKSARSLITTQHEREGAQGALQLEAMTMMPLGPLMRMVDSIKRNFNNGILEECDKGGHN